MLIFASCRILSKSSLFVRCTRVKWDSESFPTIVRLWFLQQVPTVQPTTNWNNLWPTSHLSWMERLTVPKSRPPLKVWEERLSVKWPILPPLSCPRKVRYQFFQFSLIWRLGNESCKQIQNLTFCPNIGGSYRIKVSWPPCTMYACIRTGTKFIKFQLNVWTMQPNVLFDGAEASICSTSNVRHN